jgi:flagellar hook-associated protein 3 FlgL
MVLRITTTSPSRAMMANLQDVQRKLTDSQQRIASGKQVTKPSDDPAKVLSALDYRAQLRRSEQMARNAQDAQNWLNTADSALTHGIDRLTAARTLVLQGVNGATDQGGRDAAAAELDAIVEELLQVANTQHLGRPIFSGTSAGAQAFDAATLEYRGDSGVVHRAVAPGVTIQVNRTGEDVFGIHDAADPMQGNVFQVLQATADALRAGDVTAAQSGLTAIDGATARVETVQVELGARSLQVEEVRARAAAFDGEMRQSLTQVEDVDIAEELITLRSQELAYQAALNVTARVVQPSLLDFLR